MSEPCPTCGDTFDSKRGMKIHHTRTHGESLANKTELECQHCSEVFSRTTAHANRSDSHFCSKDCFLADKRHPKEDLLSELKRLKNNLDRVPTQTDLAKHSSYSKKVYTRAFDGGWNNALKEAGMEPNRKHRSKKDCTRDLIRVAEKIGRVPTHEEHEKHGDISISTIRRKFGDWKSAISAAGLDPSSVRRYDIPEEDILNDIQRVAEKNSRTPTKKEMDLMGNYSASTIYGKFEGYNEAIKKAGLQPTRQKAITVECSECGSSVERYKYHVERSEHLFCGKACWRSWIQNNAPSGPDHHQYDPDARKNIKYGPSWPEQRRKRREYDQHTCQSCGMSSETHKDQYGMELHVHHITPARKFSDHKKRNDLSNLITLCISCHGKYERLPVKPQVTAPASD